MAEPDDKQAPPPSGGVFGNLPSTRPGRRSPRRAKVEEGGKASNGSSAAAPARSRPAPPPPPPRPTAAPPPPPPPPEERPERETAPPAGPGQRIGGVEDLAWAGIAVAAQAATVGVKAASRAMDAVRKSLDRP